MESLFLFFQPLQLQMSKLEILAVTVALIILIVTLYFTFFSNDEERPVSFSMPMPEQCSPGWEGEVLDSPSIKA